MRELLLKIRALLVRFAADEGRASASAVALSLMEGDDLFAFDGRFMRLAEGEGASPLTPVNALTAAGAACVLQRRGEDGVAAAWVSGESLERALSMAAALNLPLIMLCACREAEQEELSSLVMAADVACVPADGRSVMKLMPALRLAMDRAREGDGPTLIECLTDQIGDEEEGLLGPLERLDNVLIGEGYAMPEELK